MLEQYGLVLSVLNAEKKLLFTYFFRVCSFFCESCFRGHHTLHSPFSRGTVRKTNGLAVRTRVNVPYPKLRKYDSPIRLGITGEW